MKARFLPRSSGCPTYSALPKPRNLNPYFSPRHHRGLIQSK